MERFIEYILIAVALSMDAFAVSITIGCTMKRFRLKHAFTVGLFFGFFQAIMPVIGWLAGIGFSKFIEKIDHWIAFVLLAFIGLKMIYEAVKMKDGEDNNKDYFKFTTLLILSIATSIDALAVGVTFSILQMYIISPVIIIGLITFCFSFFGVLLGCKTSKHLFENKIEVIGGIILILIGLKILIEHLFFQ